MRGRRMRLATLRRCRNANISDRALLYFAGIRGVVELLQCGDSHGHDS
jgi:hypothetical protein